MDRDDENLVYRLIPIDGKLHQALEEFVEEYNVQASKNTRLVFFEDAIKHVCRISRVLKQPRGNLVLAGMGGSGRQSLTRIGVLFFPRSMDILEIFLLLIFTFFYILLLPLDISRIL